ncbi:hypothetical protein VTG60DRAFT_6901 [Thermothelomyces hinnuleus]
MGGVGRNLVLFKLDWHYAPDGVPDKVKERLPSRMETRIHTPGSRQPKMRWQPVGNSLGAGQYATVYKAVDLDSGKMMAAKVMMRPADGDRVWAMLKREVEILARISHSHIVDYIFSQENILYVSTQDGYHFQLGDFGLSNRQALAATCAGTPLFMAPEIVLGGKQTPKADIWSLFVTILWMMDVGGFRGLGFPAYEDLSRARAMARSDPDVRASAAQMLARCFDGVGLTAPIGQVRPIIEEEAPPAVDTKGKELAAAADTDPTATGADPRRLTPPVENQGAARTPARPPSSKKRPEKPVAVQSAQADQETNAFQLPGAFPGG